MCRQVLSVHRLDMAVFQQPTAVYRVPIAVHAVAMHQGLGHAGVYTHTSLYIHNSAG